MTLARRLIALSALTLLPLLAVEGWKELRLREARETEVRASALEQAETIAAEMGRIVDGVRGTLETAAELPAVRGEDTPGCTALFDRIRPSLDGILALAAADRNGTVFCASVDNPKLAALPSIADRTYFQRAMAGSFAVGHYAFGRQTRTHVIHFASPYRNADGVIAGVVYAALSLDWLAHEFDRPGWTKGRAFSIADDEGTILVRQPDHADFVGKQFPTELWERYATAAQSGNYDIVSPLDGIRRVVGFVPPKAGPAGFYYGVGIPRAEAFAYLDQASLLGIAAIGAAALVAITTAWIAGGLLIRRPVKALISAAERWRVGDLDARAEATGTAEFDEIATTFNRMAGDLATAMKHKDVLLRELSHRVMNSLQTIGGILFAQARQATDPELRHQFELAASRVTSVAAAYRRMHSAEGPEGVDFGGLARELCSDLSASLQSGGTCRVEADAIALQPDEALPLALILNELVTNAIKHGAGSTGEVVVKLGTTGDGCRLAVRNSGALPPAFRPESGRGFGLRMMNGLVEKLGGKLEASSMAGETEFAVTFRPRLQPRPDLKLLAASGETADAG